MYEEHGPRWEAEVLVRASVLRCMPWCILRAGPPTAYRACEHEGYRYAAASVRAATDAQERSVITLVGSIYCRFCEVAFVADLFR
jgi:hypothetical protein